MESNPSLVWFFGTAAVLGGVIFVIRLILFFVGADGHDLGGGDADLGGAGSDSGVQFLSLQSVAGFFTMFGLVGLALLSGNTSTGVALAGAILSGLLTLWIVGAMFQSMRRLHSDGTLHIENAIGQEGSVYLTIPEDGSGQVQVAVQGGLKIFNAVAANQQRIPTGRNIRVVKVIGRNVLMVEEIKTG